MKRNLLILNLILVGVALFLTRLLASQWTQFEHTHQSQALKPPAEAKKSVTPPVAVLPGQSEYFAIVNNDLFAPDRNNLIPPPPPPPPPPKREPPPKPLLSGIFRIGDDVSVLMISTDPKSKGAYKQIKVGETADGYVLEKVLDQRIVMKAEGFDPVEIRLNEPSGIVPRDVVSYTPAAAGGRQVMSVGASQEAASVTSAVSSTAPKPVPQEVPPGTVVNGKVKVMVPTPFGMMESWKDVNER
jgi:hypothetical protein